MRLLVSMVVHILLQLRMIPGMQMMKFAVNHPWKFYSYKMAFLVGLMQVTVTVIVELSIFYIELFGIEDMFSLMENYFIIIVIVDFSSNFYD